MRSRILLAAGLLAFPSAARAAGSHEGERDQLDVRIEFSGASGTTVTDAKGTHYRFGGWTIDEDKVYPEKYWGSFPLYFFGTRVGTTLQITNRGPRAKAKVRVETLAFVLRPDGSSGASLKAPSVQEFEIPRGQTRVFDASFVVEWTPAAESGLDRFLVRVSHPNEGSEDAALIMVREGVFCPPEMSKPPK